MSKQKLKKKIQKQSVMLTLNIISLKSMTYKSPLPLTDRRDAVPRAHRAVHRRCFDGQCDKL